MRSRISSPPRADWRDCLNSPWLFLLATIAFIGLTVYAFRDLVARDPYLSASGFSALSPLGWTVPISIIVALVPQIWIRRQVTQVSDFCVLYLYFFVFVPSCVMLPYTSHLSEGRQIAILLILVVAFGAVEVRRVLPAFALPTVDLRHDAIFRFVMTVMVLLECFVLLAFGGISFSNVVFIEVYENRAAFFSDTSSMRVLVGYVSNWAAFGIAPVMLIYGLHQKRYLFAALGMLAAFMAFAATSFRSHLFVPLLVVGLYYLFRATGVKRASLAVVILTLSIATFPILWDLLFNDRPALTWMIQFRFIGNNGFLTSQYFNVFETMPKGYFADSFGRFFFEPSYNIPISQVVGESFSSLPGNHANANFWADGYGNLGIFGVLFATAELVLFLWLADSIARGKSLYVTVPIMLSASFAIANTAVHTMLTSNGGLFLLLLLAALPYGAGVTARRASQLALSRP